MCKADGYKDYIHEYVEAMKDVEILILHLGTIGTKNYGKGYKHLYENGLILLLNEIRNCKNKYKNISTIILSEFGLELASLEKTVKSIQLFQYPNGWELIVYVIYSIFELIESKTNKFDNKILYFEYESDVFSKLFLTFLDSHDDTDILKYREVVPALALVTIFQSVDSAQDYYKKISNNIDKFSKLTHFPGRKINYSELNKFIDLTSPICISIQQIYDTFIELLYRNSNGKEEYLEKFKHFIEKILVVSLDSMHSKTKLQNYPFVQRSFMEVAKLHEVEKQNKQIDIETIKLKLVDRIDGHQIIYGYSVIICSIILMRLDAFNKNPKKAETFDHPYKTSQFLYDFVKLLTGINSDLNVIIGDVGLELKIHEKIEGKYQNEYGMDGFKDIKEIKFEEDPHSVITYI